MAAAPALAGAALAQDKPADPLPEPPKAPAAPSRYDVDVELIGAPKDLRERLKLVSRLANGGRAPPTRAAIRQMGRKDAAVIESALKASGRYAARVSFELDGPRAEGDASDDLTARFKIDAGPAHRIVAHAIVYADATDGPPRADAPAGLGLKLGTNAAGATLQENQRKILDALWSAGYPGARSVSRRAEATGTPGEARAIYVFETGPEATFGELEISGAEQTKPTFLDKLKTWETGARFDRAKLVGYRETLSQTGLFSSVDVDNGSPDETGRAPVLVDLDERKRRTIGVGASFSTVEGPGGRLFFEYRNLFGAGESARAEIEASEIEQAITFGFDKPLPTLPGSAFAAFEFANETTNAFDARTVAVSGGVAKRWLDGRLETRAGLALETSRVESEDTDERTFFVSLPLSAVWNTEDDPLALENGERVSLTLTPFTGTETFTRAELNARTRTHVGANDRYTAAFRARLGSLFGAPFDDVPQNQRFFSGGGSSVRGFDFQTVGPLDEDDNPVGGRSVIEGAVELRARTIANVQLAAFLDAGSVSDRSAPDFGGDFLVGVGGGARYLSPIGPLRVDVAFPLDRRESDRAWQLFISLGQPF
ncbi:MAG: autotransporter assembly complex family protein [Parvularculaceae bacterium]